MESWRPMDRDEIGAVHDEIWKDADTAKLRPTVFIPKELIEEIRKLNEVIRQQIAETVAAREQWAQRERGFQSSIQRLAYSDAFPPLSGELTESDWERIHELLQGR